MRILPRQNLKVNTLQARLALDMAREFIAKHPVPPDWDEDQMWMYETLWAGYFLYQLKKKKEAQHMSQILMS